MLKKKQRIRQNNTSCIVFDCKTVLQLDKLRGKRHDKIFLKKIIHKTTTFCHKYKLSKIHKKNYITDHHIHHFFNNLKNEKLLIINTRSTYILAEQIHPKSFILERKNERQTSYNRTDSYT
jgi:hypothetical protein